MRCFIGVPLSDDVRRELIRIQGELKKSTTKMKLVEPENLHITLRFLGDIGDSEVSKITEKLKEISVGKFAVTFSHLGAFPSKNYMRVIWVGVSQGREELTELHRQVGGKEKKFEPHVTLARVKTKPDKMLVDLLGKTLNLPMNVDKVQLVESKLTPKGPIYSKVFEIELR